MSLVKSTLRFASGTLLSRLTGVLRESVVGAVFGASAMLDAFIVAYRIPNLLRDLLAEGALGNSFTKVYSALFQKDEERARVFLCETLVLVTAITSSICVAGFVFSHDIVSLVTDFSKGNTYTFDTTVALTRLLFPYIIFASLGSVVMGGLFQKSSFFVSSVSPMLFNLANILGALVLGPLFEKVLPESLTQKFGDAGILGLSVGVLLGGVLQFTIQLWSLWSPLFVASWKKIKIIPISKEFVSVLGLMLPMIIASSAAQINVVVNTNFATGLETGSVSWLNYAFRILQLPVGMFGVAIGSVALPTLVRTIAHDGQKLSERSSKQFFDALNFVIWLTLPCFVIMFVFCKPIVVLLYQAGRFGSVDVAQTSAALQAYSFAVVGYAAIKVMTSLYYALDKTYYAMFISMICVGLNYLFNALLVVKFGHVGLATTAAVTLSLSALFLFAGAKYFGATFESRKSFRLIFGLIVATAVSFTIGFFIDRTFLFLDSSVLRAKLAAAFELCVGGGVIITIYSAAALWAFQKHPREVMGRFKRRG